MKKQKNKKRNNNKKKQAQRRAATDRLAAKLELTKTSFNFLCFKNPNFRSPEKHEILHRHAQWFVVTIFKISKTKHKSLLFFSDFQRFLVNRKWFRRPFSDRHQKLFMYVGGYQKYNAKCKGRSDQQFLRNQATKNTVLIFQSSKTPTSGHRNNLKFCIDMRNGLELLYLTF